MSQAANRPAGRGPLEIQGKDLEASGWLRDWRLSSNRDLHAAPAHAGSVPGITGPERLAAWAVPPTPIAGLPGEGCGESQGSLLRPETVVFRERHDFPQTWVVTCGKRGRKVIAAWGQDIDLLPGRYMSVKMSLVPGVDHRVQQLGVLFIVRFLRVPDREDKHRICHRVLVIRDAFVGRMARHADNGVGVVSTRLGSGSPPLARCERAETFGPTTPIAW
jgi:hypothetical protein